jgi:hypothetical protein
MTEQRPAYQYRGLFRVSRVEPCVISLADLRRLYADLNAKTAEALELHLGPLLKPADIEQTQFDELKAQARAEAHLTVTVLGSNGEQFVTRSVAGLADDNLPETITQITFDSASALQAYNATPLNRFTLRLDFSEPPGFDSYNPWDQPTPNSSQLEVIGSDQTWVTAVHESTLAFLRRRGRRRSWLHKHQWFNVLSWLVGLPSAFWIVYRIDSSLPVLGQMHTALRGALNVYLFLVAFLLFRGVLWGFRWLFPVVELEGARSTRVRGFVGVGLGSLLLALLYDVLKTLW